MCDGRGPTCRLFSVDNYFVLFNSNLILTYYESSVVFYIDLYIRIERGFKVRKGSKRVWSLQKTKISESTSFGSLIRYP